MPTMFPTKSNGKAAAHRPFWMLFPGILALVLSRNAVQPEKLMQASFPVPVSEIDLSIFYLCYNSTHPMTSQMKDFSDYICSLPKDFN